MLKRIAFAAAFLGVPLFAGATMAQSGGAVTGVVRDSMDRPMPEADVVLIPAKRRARTDSLGRFEFRSLDDGQYVVRARRIGYLPTEWSVKLSKAGHVNVTLVLGPHVAMLDTMYVATDGPCPRDTYEGFLCRRTKAKGTFVDFTDIDTMQVDYSAELLRDIGGFNVDVQPTKNGPTRVASARRCTIVLLNGVATSWSQIPEAPYMITGIEVYKTKAEIPKEFARYTWGKEDCWLVAYWTYDFRNKPVRKVSLP
jgi:hypothetical protein